MTKSSPTINTNLKDIVIERLRRLPSHLEISIGDNSYTTTSLIQSVQSEDNVGHQVANIQLKYLQDLASGRLYLDD